MLPPSSVTSPGPPYRDERAPLPRPLHGLSSTISFDQEPSDPGHLQVLRGMEILASFISRFLSPADVTCIMLPWLLGLPAPVCWYRTSLDVFSQGSVSPAFFLLQKAWMRVGLICCCQIQPEAHWLLSKTRVQGEGRKECQLCECLGTQKRQGEPDGMT